MKKKSIYIMDCKKGDILAQNIYNRWGTLVIAQKTTIDDHIITTIINLGISEIDIYIKDNNNSHGEKSYKEFVMKYTEKVENIKNILDDLALGKNLDIEQIENISKDLYKEINSKNNLIQCLISIKNFNQKIYNHCLNVSLYSMLIAEWLQLSQLQIKEVTKTALLHDIGKTQIPEEILEKKDILDDIEMEIIKQHPIHSYNLIKNIPGITMNILKGVIMHHERNDGSGYPLGLTKSKITLYAKIISIADIYDTYLSENKTPFEIFELLKSEGLSKLDTKITFTFLEHISNYYIGNDILLNTGEKAKIVNIMPNNLSNPIIKLNDKIIYLFKEKDLEIVELLPHNNLSI